MSYPRAGQRALLVPLAGLVALALAGCGGGSDAKAAVPAPAGTTFQLEAGPVNVDASGNPAQLSDADRNAIVDTVRRYVVAATINPLTGKPVGDLTPLFTPPASLAVQGPDRAAAVDDGVPKATSTVKVDTSPMLLTALSDPAGAINLVGASLYLDATTRSAQGPVQVKRSGELVLSRDTGNTWKIASFRLTADRTGAGIDRAAATGATGATTASSTP
jgi:hypothetical protein